MFVCVGCVYVYKCFGILFFILTRPILSLLRIFSLLHALILMNNRDFDDFMFVFFQ